FRLLDQLATYDRPTPLVVLTGGDPFERGDLAELTRYGTSLGLNVSLSPSVTPRLTRQRLEALREAGGSALSLSLDGATAATHDRFRGFEGTYAATLAAARMVTDIGYRLQINSTITAGNVREAPALLARVIELGAKLWSVFFLVPTGRGAGLGALTADQREDVLHWLHDVSDRVAVKTTEAPHYRRVVLQKAAGTDTAELGDLYRQLTELTATALAGVPIRQRPARPPIDVNAGRGFVFIDHQGKVYPSGFLPHVAGDVRQTPLPQIYREADIMRSLRTPTAFGGKCGQCEFADVCGGSRSRAYAVTGDPLASDPSCAYVPATCPSKTGDAVPG
ncbi:MAG: TIGR04053 family radical SAM/SPASM domain-containing protein, partial [Propionibacteriaceae bacterium]|nr:TIGR04053 family radical SAM/SPASM domain-containing protein [Propionibacteriaceae bacterium]